MKTEDAKLSGESKEYQPANAKSIRTREARASQKAAAAKSPKSEDALLSTDLSGRNGTADDTMANRRSTFISFVQL